MHAGYLLSFQKIYSDSVACIAIYPAFIDVREWLESRDRMIMLTHFDYSAVLPEIVVGSEAVETGNRVFVLSEWIGYLYLAGVVVLLVRLAVQAFSLYRLIVRMPEKR